MSSSNSSPSASSSSASQNAADQNAQNAAAIDQVNLAAAALAISLVALLATFLQLMQQYVLTAGGYHKVGQKVMGYWGKSRKLRLLWQEFRVEVQFETPVIFVCEPTNTRFPAGDKAWFIHAESRVPIERDLRRRWDHQTLMYFLLWGWMKWVFGGRKRRWWWRDEPDEKRGRSRKKKQENGSETGIEIERTTGTHGLLSQFWRMGGAAAAAAAAEAEDAVAAARARLGRPPSLKRHTRVNTTHAEVTSWVRLLDGLQTMEEASIKWQLDTCNGAAGPPSRSVAAHLGRAMESRTITVALQPFHRSWDMMPAGLTKPYATTTMCHLVELLAMLGIHWDEFDRIKHRYRAEGNGYVVTGEKIPELGLVFSISQFGKSRFEETRLIPVDGIKDLCFGKADTIYSDSIDPRRLEPTEIENMSSLQLSTATEITETLRVLGCNTNTVNIFLQGKRTKHIFPIVFELLGMLARTFHIEHTLFRYLPNPTEFTWDRREFSIREMIYSYETLLSRDLEREEENPPSPSPSPSVVKLRLLGMLAELRPYLPLLQEKNRRHPPEPLFLQLLHTILDELDELLTAKKKAPRLRGQPVTAAGNKLVSETVEQAERRKLVRDVLRSHIQTVLYVLTREDEDARTPRIGRHAMSIEYRIPEHLLPLGTRIEDIDAAPPEGDNNRQAMLMELYFDSVRPYVIDQARGTTNSRARARWRTTSERHDLLSASPTSRWVGTAGRGLDHESGIARAPTEPRHQNPKFRADPIFVSPGIKRSWTLPSSSSGGEGGGSGHAGHAGSLSQIIMGGGRKEKKSQRPAADNPATPTTAIATPTATATTPTTTTTPQIHLPEPAAEAGAPPEVTPPTSTEPESGPEGGKEEKPPGANGAPRPHFSLAGLESVTHEEIWCVLVFRMLCWLTLHDFHKKDKQTVESDLLGSRLPVFIA